MSGARTTFAAALLALLALPLPAAAQTLLAGGLSTRIADRPGTQHDSAQASFKKDPALKGLATTPLCASAVESTARIATDSGAIDVGLPCFGWKRVGKGFRYRDKAAAFGPFTSISIGSSGSLKLVAGGPAVGAVRGPSSFVEAAITIGSQEFCGRFESFRKNTPAAVIARGPSKACAPHPAPELFVLNPSRGGINEIYGIGIGGKPTIAVVGQVTNVPPAHLTVMVNGDTVPPLFIEQDGSFTWQITATDDWFQEIVVEAIDKRSGWVTRERRIAMHGPVTPAGGLTPTQAAFVHATGGEDGLTTSLTTKLEPAILAELKQKAGSLKQGALALGKIVDHECAHCDLGGDTPCSNGQFCDGWITVTLTDLAYGQLQNYLTPSEKALATVDETILPNLSVTYHVEGDFPFGNRPNCDGVIDAGSLIVDQTLVQQSSFGGAPGDVFVYNRPTHASFVSPWNFHWIQRSGLIAGSVCPDFDPNNDNRGNNTTWDKWLARIRGKTPDVEALVEDGFDASFPNEFAQSIQQRLNAISVAQPIAAALGKRISTLYDPGLIDHLTNNYGYTYGLDVLLEPQAPAPSAPHPAGAYAPAAALPAFADRTVDVDSGGGPLSTPYDLALGVTEAPFNQLLKALVEEGQFAFAAKTVNGAPLTAGLMASLFCPPGYCPLLSAAVPAGTPVTIYVKPEIAPILRFEPHPDPQVGGFLLDARGLSLQAVAEPGNGAPSTLLFSGSFDLQFGLKVEFIPGPKGPGTRVHPSLTAPKGAPAFHVLANPFHMKEGAIAALLPGQIQASLGSLALPIADFDLPRLDTWQLTGLTIDPPPSRPDLSRGWLTLYFTLD